MRTNICKHQYGSWVRKMRKELAYCKKFEIEVVGREGREGCSH